MEFWTGPNVRQSIWLADIWMFWTGPNTLQGTWETGSLVSGPSKVDSMPLD